MIIFCLYLFAIPQLEGGGRKGKGKKNSNK